MEQPARCLRKRYDYPPEPLTFAYESYMIVPVVMIQPMNGRADMNLKTSDMAICAETSAFSIRDYSDQGLLGPVPREENNHYRFFDPRLIPQVYLLRALRELGLSSQQFAEYGNRRTPQSTQALFRGYSARLEIELMHLQANLDMLRSYLSLIDEGLAAASGKITLCALQERPVRFSSLERYSSRTSQRERLRRAFGQIRQNGNAGCPLGFVYKDFLDFLEKPDVPAQLVSFDPCGPDTRPAGEYLVGTQACFYGEANDLPRRMFQHALQSGLELSGPAFTVYLFDAACVTEPEQYLLQACVGVKRTQARG